MALEQVTTNEGRLHKLTDIYVYGILESLNAQSRLEDNNLSHVSRTTAVVILQTTS